MRNFLHKSLVIFSLIFSGSLLISYLAPLIKPESFWLPAFWGLAYPYLLAVNVLFVLYWVFRKKWSFLLPLLAIAIGFSQLSDFVQFNASKKIPDSEATIKVLSYNVRSFDKYQWTKDPNTPANILKLVKESNADIVCFQEFRATKNGFLSLSNLKSETGTTYASLSKARNGAAILSKYPIVKSGEIKFEKGNWCNAIFTDLKINSDTIRIYNLHLESNRLGGRNYAFINKKEFNADEEELEEIKDISFRLRHAFIRRAKQAQIIRNHISKSPHRTIVCGDFNDTAHSYAYKTIKGELTDCFRERGFGISTTYSGDFPSFRIDFILRDQNMSCLAYKRIKKPYSDHFPILATIAL